MGLIRVIIATFIGSFMWRSEGWPISPIIFALPLAEKPKGILFVITLGVIVGLIAGSSIWGAVSALAIVPCVYLIMPFLFSGEFGSLEHFFDMLRIIHLEAIFYTILGALIGGTLYSKFTGKDDYLILRIKNT